MTTQALIADVRSVDKRTKDGRPWKKYEIVLGDGQVLQARQEVANEAWKFKGQLAELEVESKQNGQYINHYLNDVRPPGMTPNGNLPPWEQQGAGQPANAAAYQPAQQAAQAQTEAPSAYDMRIYRQCAAKVSASLSTDPREFWDNLDDLMTYFVTGRKPSVMSAGEEFARAVVAQSDPNPDDDIPF